MNSLSTPITFLIFRRPDLTAKVFETIRQAQPRQLFIVADGSRNEAEEILCQQARAVTEVIDWECEVFRNYADKNLGCRRRVSSGLDWVFAQVEKAIILEDDCLPDPSFFKYCEELLEYYQDDMRIWAICGNNFQDSQWRGDGSYYYSNYFHAWGWATWNRTWQKYDYHLSNWQKFKQYNYLENILDDELEVEYWYNIFEKMALFGEPDTWDYPWIFSCWQWNGLTILPNVNIVSNIGYRSDGTHTTEANSKFADLNTSDISEGFKHPSFMIRDKVADRYTFDHVFGGFERKRQIRESKFIKNRLIRQLRKIKKIIFD